MALSSWNALYTHYEQKFMLKRQWKQLSLLKVFTQHADCFGLSYPGDDRIKELTGIGSTAQLNEYLQFLVDGEYIKVWETWNGRRKKWDRDFQVSPLVMYIREEYQGYCEMIWNTGERDFDLESAIVMKLNGQPASESESESTSVTNISNQHHHPANKPATKQQGRLSGDGYANQAERPKQRKRKTGTARSTEKDPQAGGPPPPDKIDLRKYQSPLPVQAEDRAQDLTLMFRMRISQARGLVANYGPDAIDGAGRAVMDAIEKGICTNPAGLLTHLLKRGGSHPDDRAIYPTRAEQIAAANADLDLSAD